MVEASRVAEVIAELPDGTTTRGSGYRTADTAVLTAAHVVANAARVRVRFDADTEAEWAAVATCQWSDTDADLAVLSIEPRADIPPARFGRVGDRDAVLPATAVGFPLWKLKNYDGTVVTDDGRPRYRDTHQAGGMVAVLSNRREGTLEFTVTPPERETDPETSPWQGMSGAALWIGDRIVGVIARHHRADGLGRLTAVRLTPEVLDILGVTEPLPDAGRPRVSDLILTDYRKQVAAIAPEQLLEREDDLADLTRFVAGDEPYLWWQAGPWAGKSALMSWFVLHPPEGVDVVSFFVTGRLAAQDDSDAFTKELTLQLAALTGEHLPDVLTPDGRQNQLWRLLDEAAQRSRRLLVVIDGLDEDSGPAHGKPSIASLLPQRPPPGVRILIASRPDPQVPADVLDDDHPLLTCPRRQLPVSPHAQSKKRRAVNELNRHLGGDQLHRDVLGLITASGGGLTRGDLEELTNEPPYEIDRLLDGLLGRTIGSRPAPLRPEENNPVHLFAHETLAEAARDKFGASVRTYRDRIHAWADTFRDKGWPPDTPQYLLLGYPHMLVDAEDHDRLVAVSTDRTRHDRMLLTTGGDALATSEVRRAQDILCGRPSPDLSALLLLAVHSDELAHRNYGIPARLPLVWAMLGDTTRADALAHGITAPETRAHSLVALAQLAAATGDHDWFQALVTDARGIAHGLTQSYTRDNLLDDLARTVAAAGEPDLAISIAHDMVTDYKMGDLLAELAESAAASGDFGLALRFGAGISYSHSWADTRAQLALSAAEAGQYEQAWPLLGEAAEHYVQADTAKKFVLNAVAADEYDLVHRFLAAATTSNAQAAGFAAAAEAAAAKDDYEHALGFALSITEPVRQAQTLTRLARLAQEADDHDRMTSLFEEAWARTNGITDHHTRAQAAIAVLEEKPEADLPIPVHTLLTGAEEFVRAVPDAKDRADLLHRLAAVAASAADGERVRSLLVESEQLINQVTGEQDRERARISLLWHAIEAGEHEWVSARLNWIEDQLDRASATTTLAEAIAADNRDRALALLAEVVTLARGIDVDTAEFVLQQMAGAATRIGAHERVLTLVNDIADTGLRNVALAKLAQAAIENDDHEHAWSVAGHLTDDSDDEAFADLSLHFATAGHHDRALFLVRRIPDMDDRHRALTQLAEEVAKAGDYERAREWALCIDDDMNRTNAQASLVRMAAAAGAWHQAATIVRDMTDDWPAANDALADLVEAVEKAGELELALTLARDLASPDQLPDLLTQLADTALSAGDRDRVRMLLTEVATATAALPESEVRFDVLVEAVEVAVAAGEHGQALALARQITEFHLHAHALTQLAEAAAEEGDHQTARELVIEAEEVARNIGNAVRPDAITALAVASFLVGEQERARGLVQGIPDFGMRARALAELATATGDPEVVCSLLTDAATVAGDIPDARERAQTLIWLVGVAGQSEQTDLLRSLVTEAEEAVATVADDVHRVHLLTSLARATAADHQDTARSLLAEAESLAGGVPADHRSEVQSELVGATIEVGDLARARVLAEDIADSFERHDALARLARAADAAGDHELALTIVRGIDNSFRRHEALRRLVEQATVAGDHDRVRTLVSTTTDWYQVGQLLTWLAKVATATGDHERALSLVRDNPRTYGLSEGLVWLTQAAVAGGDHERARGLAEEIPEIYRADAEGFLSGDKPAVPGLYSRLYPREPVLDMLIAAGDREQALIVARDFDPADQAPLLTTLVDAEIAAGDLDRAVTVAREITMPASQATALSHVVEAAAAAGDTAGARALLAEVLLLGQWHESVQLMARVAPDSLAPVLAELESRCGV